MFNKIIYILFVLLICPFLTIQANSKGLPKFNIDKNIDRKNTENSTNHIADITQNEISKITSIMLSQELNQEKEFLDEGMLDLSGFVLGMSKELVQSFLKNKNIRFGIDISKKSEQEMHRFYRYNLDYVCRQSLTVPSEISKCIHRVAQQNNWLYQKVLFLKRNETAETIELHFTSPLANSKVWKIVYTNDAGDTDGLGEKFEYQRKLKIFNFWQSAEQKYGPPNSGDNYWLTGSTKASPYILRTTSSLTLINEAAEEVDNFLNQINAQKTFEAKHYMF